MNTERRLIDANALEFLCFSHIDNYSIFSPYLEDYKRGFNDAVMRDIGIINNAPTIEERPKGKWIRTGSLGNGNAHYTCSNCSHGDEHAECQEVPYCWHCGADMRGDV